MENLTNLKRKMGADISDSSENNGIIKKNKGNGVRNVRFSITEVKGDLFSSPESFSLVNCVALDFRMGKGIATLFKMKFGGIQELNSQRKKVGETAILKRGNRFIYYLITKEKSTQKPTYLNLRYSLTHLKDHAIENNVTFLAMPKIGCGLDKLVWEKVKDIVTDIFKETDISIVVYHL